MTELCDYFKVWFPQVSVLHDPDDKEATEGRKFIHIGKFYNQNIFESKCGNRILHRAW